MKFRFICAQNKKGGKKKNSRRIQHQRINMVLIPPNADQENGSGSKDVASATESLTSGKATRIQVGLEYVEARSKKVLGLE